SSRRRHTRSYGDWSSDVCSSDLRRHDEPDTAEASSHPPLASPSTQGPQHSPVLPIRKEKFSCHEVVTLSPPTTSPRLFFTGCVSRSGSATPSGARNAASAGPSGREVPSSAMSATPVVPSAAQRRPSAPPFANQ